jgi:hypothetical protein
MIEIFVIFSGEYVLRNESNVTIERDDSLLLPGNYYIDSRGISFSDNFFCMTNLIIASFHINNEAPLVRTMSSPQTGQRV